MVMGKLLGSNRIPLTEPRRAKHWFSSEDAPSPLWPSHAGADRDGHTLLKPLIAFAMKRSL